MYDLLNSLRPVGVAYLLINQLDTFTCLVRKVPQSHNNVESEHWDDHAFNVDRIEAAWTLIFHNTEKYTHFTRHYFNALILQTTKENQTLLNSKLLMY